jgi:hypothetical protein
MSDLFEILSSAVGPAVRQPVKSAPEAKRFETDGSPSITCVGYTADEVIELLAAYREHVTRMLSIGKAAQADADSMRYTPAPGFEGFAGSDGG